MNILRQLLVRWRSVIRYKEKSVITKVVTLFSFSLVSLVSPDKYRDSHSFLQRFFLRARMESERVFGNLFCFIENQIPRLLVYQSPVLVLNGKLNLLQMETGPNAPIEIQKTFICNETIIIDLIKQDLINWKMINLLQNMQVRANDYQLDIGSIIFEMMNLNDREDVDELFEKYVELSKPILKLSTSQSNRKIDVLAAKIYDYLEGIRQE